MTYKQPYQKLINLPKIPSPFIFYLNDPGRDFRLFSFSLSAILNELNFEFHIQRIFLLRSHFISVSAKMSRNLIWKILENKEIFSVRIHQDSKGSRTTRVRRCTNWPAGGCIGEKKWSLPHWSCTGTLPIYYVLDWNMVKSLLAFLILTVETFYILAIHIGQNFGGQNFRKPDWLRKFCPPKYFVHWNLKHVKLIQISC